MQVCGVLADVFLFLSCLFIYFKNGMPLMIFHFVGFVLFVLNVRVRLMFLSYFDIFVYFLVKVPLNVTVLTVSFIHFEN